MKLLIAFLTVSLAIVACDEEDGDVINCKYPVPEVGAIEIAVEEDTLRFLPGDSASTNITVIVIDGNGNHLAGIPVAIALSNPQLGFIEYLDTELRDTTNALGRVNVVYTAIGIAGTSVITASAAGISRTKQIVIQEQEIVIGALSITVTPDTVRPVEGDSVSVIICITVVDVNGDPIEGIALSLSAAGGRLSPPLEVDSLQTPGRTCYEWFIYDEMEAGLYCFEIRVGLLTRNFCITVLPPEGTGSLSYIANGTSDWGEAK